MNLPEDARIGWIEQNSDLGSPLRQRLLALIAGDRLANLRTGGARDAIEDERLPDRIGAYRIVGRIGRGGMGAVYRGERMTGDFAHTAAIKVIKPGLLSERLVERFERERQTLAGLAHPNITQLFDGGSTEAGDPYIVMELVDGMSLGDWIETAVADRAARIGVFLSICDAVGFAHQNLIIHRDITLSNILVTPSGVPKLIDFGISRPPAAAPSHDLVSPVRSLEGLSLTPGFAAPERVAGEAATTLSDIYSLGVVLDRLFPAPRDRDVAAIIARACAAAPEERYPSADALADDLKAWRDGLPVVACGGGRTYVLRKFVARNWLAVTASVLALVALVGALSATLVANRRAEAARIVDEKRFEQTRSLAKIMMFDVYDSVSAIPGSTDARFLLARTAQHYLDALASDPAAPADLRLEVGEGYFRLARVVGSTGGQSLGKREDAKPLYDRAHRFLTEVHAAAPDRADARIALAHLLAVRAGERLYGEDDSKTARKEARQARALLEALPQLNARAAGALTGAYLYEGDSWGWDNDIPAAGRVYEAGLRSIAAMPQAIRDSLDVGTSHSGLLRQSGEVYRYTGQPERAIARMAEAVELNRRLIAVGGGRPADIRKLISSLNTLADTQLSQGQLKPALTIISEAQSVAQKAAAANPTDAGAQEFVALVGITLAKIESALGAHARAIAAAEQVIAIRQALARTSGNNKGARITLAVGLKEAASIFRAGGNKARGCSALRESVAILDKYLRGGGLSDYDRQNTLEPSVAALKACTA